MGEDLVNGNVKVIMELIRRNKRTGSSQNCEGHGLEDVVFEEEWSLKRRVLLCSSKNGGKQAYPLRRVYQNALQWGSPVLSIIT